MLAFTPAGLAQGGDQTKITDSNTVFHRVYVYGDGDSGAQDEEIARQGQNLKTELEKHQKDGSKSYPPLVKPTRKALEEFLDKLKTDPLLKPKSGEEVTFYIRGHGWGENGNGGIRLSSTHPATGPDGDQRVITDDQLAAALNGFEDGVTLVVILDACYGGSFIDDIGETPTRKVIGTKGICWFDMGGLGPGGILGVFGWFVKTLTEAVTEKVDDGGTISGDDLKQHVEGAGYELGVPTTGTKVKKGKSACVEYNGEGNDLGPCAMPSITLHPEAGAGDDLAVSGQGFSVSSSVAMTLHDADQNSWALGSVSTDSGGAFTTSVTVPNVPPGRYLLDASDSLEFEDRFIDLVVTPSNGHAGGSVPTLSQWGLLALGVALAGSGVFLMRRQRAK